MAIPVSSAAEPPVRKNAISKDLSQAIERLRFPLAVAVVFIHAAEMTIWLPGGASSRESSGQNWPTFLIQFFSEVLARIAVPAFFMISGFLLCASHPAGGGAWWSKIKSRIKSLLVPFLFWNFLVLLLYAGGQAFGPTKRFFSGRFLPVGQATFRDYANALLGFEGMPINAPLWFVRDLFLLVLIAPVLVFLVRRWAAPVLLGLLGLWLGLFPVAWRLPLISAEAILFFTVGVALAYRAPSLQLPRTPVTRLIPLGYLVLGLIEAFVVTFGSGPPPLLHQLNIVVGVGAVFIVADHLGGSSPVAQAVSRLAPTAFFMFAAHAPLLGLFRKLMFIAIHPENPWVKFFWLYCMAGWLTVLGCVGFFLMLVRFWPSFLRLSSGFTSPEPKSLTNPRSVQP
jgi:peptidoglycan/LPS O-acetylase OafA/YrhL